MKFIVTTSSAFGTGVSDVLSAILPPHIVAVLLHIEAKLFLGLRPFHDRINGIAEIHLPTLSTHCTPEFTSGYAVSFLSKLRLLECCHSVLLTNLITELTQFLQCELVGVVLQTCLSVDRIENEVRVNVVGIDVSSHHDFVTFERSLCKLDREVFAYAANS